MKRPWLAFEADGARFRVLRLPAWDQFALLQRAQAVIALCQEGAGAPEGAMIAALVAVPEADLRVVMRLALGGVQIHRDGEWMPFWDTEAEAPLVEGFGLTGVTLVTLRGVLAQLGRFMTFAGTEFAARGASPVAYEPVEMAEGRSYLMLPVTKGLMRLESLFDGTLDLWHVALANDALAVEGENQSRIRAALSPQT